MTEREKDGRRGLALLQQIKPPLWMSEMQRYYTQHGRFRSEDLHRLMETAGQTGEPIAQQESRAIELLQHLATKRK
jgi:hypothetical protein